MPKENVHNIKEEEFSKIIADKKPKLIIVDFFAEWCMPCVTMGPIIEKLAEKNKDVKFCKINVDDAPKLSQEYEISSIPCIVFFQDGKEVDRLIGARSEQDLQEEIRDYLEL